MLKHKINKTSYMFFWSMLALLILTTLSEHFILSQDENTTPLVIYISNDSLVLFIDANPPAVSSISGLAFKVENQTDKTYALEDYSQFSSINFSSLVTPTCLRLHLDRETLSPLPTACPNNNTFSHQLHDADAFWINLLNNVTIPLIVTGSSDGDKFCSFSQSTCAINFITTSVVLPSIISTLSPTPQINLFVTSNNQWSIQESNYEGIRWVLVPAGCFDMGDSQEGGRQCLDSFWITKYEITELQYKENIGGNKPATNVRWMDARDYCTEINGRLPSELEWEYAARGPDGWLYPWGNEFDTTKLNTGSALTDVNWFPQGASWVGALNMISNVREWTNSIDLPYPYASNDGREDVSSSNPPRVLRGGSIDDFRNGEIITTFSRDSLSGDADNIPNTGFRCVVDFEGLTD